MIQSNYKIVIITVSPYESRFLISPLGQLCHSAAPGTPSLGVPSSASDAWPGHGDFAAPNRDESTGWAPLISG